MTRHITPPCPGTMPAHIARARRNRARTSIWRVGPLALASVAITLCLSVNTPAQAALSPFYDRATQIEALLQSESLADALSQGPIDSLRFMGSDADGSTLWEIVSGACIGAARLQAQPPQPGMVGKTSYQLADFTPSCSN